MKPPAQGPAPTGDQMICRACGRQERASEGYPCAGCGTFICVACNMSGVTHCKACQGAGAPHPQQR